MKKRVLEWVKMAQRIGECVESLEAEDRLVLDILCDECGEKIMRICDEVCVSEPTAYRRKDRVLHRLLQLFAENDVRIS